MYQCKCGKTYSSYQGLRNHKLTKHAGARQQVESPVPTKGVGRLTLPARRNPFRPSFVEAALKELGIEHVNLTVKMTGGYRTLGTTRGLRDGSYVITISHNSSDKSNTLWHELTHVQQSEQYGGFAEFIKAYERYSVAHRTNYVSRAYQANPFEVEARKRGEVGFNLELGK